MASSRCSEITKSGQASTTPPKQTRKEAFLGETACALRLHEFGISTLPERGFNCFRPPLQLYIQFTFKQRHYREKSYHLFVTDAEFVKLGRQQDGVEQHARAKCRLPMKRFRRVAVRDGVAVPEPSLVLVRK